MSIQYLKNVRLHFDLEVDSLTRFAAESGKTAEQMAEFSTLIADIKNDDVKYMYPGKIHNFTAVPELNGAFGLAPGDRRFATYDLDGATRLDMITEQQDVVKRLRALQEAGKASLNALAQRLRTETRLSNQEVDDYIRSMHQMESPALKAWQLRSTLNGTFGRVSTRRPSELYHWDCPVLLRASNVGKTDMTSLKSLITWGARNYQAETYADAFYGTPRLRTIAAYVQIALEDWSK